MVSSDVWMIAAVARDGTVGAGGRIPWHIPEDLRRFRELTTGAPVIMGRLTYESLDKPLSQRDNIVLSSSVTELPGATVADSVEAALDRGRASHLYGPKGIAIIGGAAVYRAFLAHSSRLELTIVDCEPDGDAHFPFIDPTTWSATAGGPKGSNPSYRFVTLERY